MDELDQAFSMLFVLSLVLIIVAYFVGFSTDLNALVSGLTTLIQTATGRNSAGQFAGYPGGAGNGTTSFTAALGKTTTA